MNHHQGRQLRFAAALFAAGALALPGCRTYAPRPIDAERHALEFLSRSPESIGALGLAGRPPRHGREDAIFDPSDGICIDEAEAIALVFNAELRRARAAAGVAGARADHAGLWDDPVLGVDLARIIQNVPDPWVLGATIGFTIPISGRLEAAVKLADAEHAAALVRVAEKEWETRAELRRRWAGWSAAARRRDVLSELSDELDSLLATIEAMERAGAIAPLEAGLFHIERASRRIQLARAEARTEESERGLLQLMGLSPAARARLIASDPAREMDGSFEELTGAALDRNLSIAAAAAEHSSAERRLAGEIRRQYPDLRIGPGYGFEDGDDRALLNLAIPLPLLNRNRQGIAEAEALREQADIAHQAEVERVVSELGIVMARLEIAKTMMQALRDDLAPRIEKHHSQSRRLAELGEFDAALLLETLTRHHDVRLSVVDAWLDERLAWIDLEALVGPAPGDPASVDETEEEAAP